MKPRLEMSNEPIINYREKVCILKGEREWKKRESERQRDRECAEQIRVATMREQGCGYIYKFNVLIINYIYEFLLVSL